jgi:hypothetical protein
VPLQKVIGTGARTDQVNAVHDLLASTADPEHTPNQGSAGRLSAAMAAQVEAKGAQNSLFLPPRRPRRLDRSSTDCPT